MTTPDLVTSGEAAEILGVDHSTVSRWSDERLQPDERKLIPVMRLRGRTGTKLFAREHVEALRDELEAERAS